MSEPTLTDVTQVLLKQNQELTVNTAETKQTKSGIEQLSKVLGDYFKNQQRLDEGDRLENKREESDAKAGGGDGSSLDVNKAIADAGVFAIPFIFIGAIRGLITGLTIAFAKQIATIVKFAGKVLFGNRFVKPIIGSLKTLRLMITGTINAKVLQPIVSFFKTIGGALKTVGFRFAGLNPEVMKGINALKNFGSNVKGGFFGFINNVKAFFGKGGGLSKAFQPISNAFQGLQQTLRGGGKIGVMISKALTAIKNFFPAIFKIMRSVGTLFVTIGKAILLPLQIVIGAVQFIRGFIEGFTKNVAEEGVLKGILIGALEGIKKAINTLFMAPLDMIKNFIGFLVGFISTDASEAIKGFSFAGLFSGIIDSLVSFIKNPMAAIEKIARGLIKFPVAVLAGAKAALKNLLRPSKIPSAFNEAFTKTLNSVGSGEADAAAGAMIAKRDSTFNEKIAENRAAEQGQQGGGEPVVIDNTTNNNVSNDNSQSMTSQIEPPIDNKSRVAGGSAIMRGRRGAYA